MPRSNSWMVASFSRYPHAPAIDRVHDVGVLVGDGQDDDARERRDRGDLPRRFDAALPRHLEIHEDDVGRVLLDQPHGFVAVDGLADDLDVLLFEQRPQTCSKQVMVVDEQNPNARGARIRLARCRSLPIH